jgi:UDP-4-amino-4,6-dideoxy-N-acetyl-beta-L-altrosamine N-acetyltransferase
MLIGHFVKLRAVERTDSPIIVRWRNDPAVMDHFFEYEPLSLVQQERWFESFLTRRDEKLFIIALPDGTPLGTVGLVDIDWRNRRAEWGRFYIGDPAHRMGTFGAEAEFLIIQYVFVHLNLHKLYCKTFSFNTTVLSLHKRFGFVEEGVLREHIYRKGKYEDVTVMSLLAREFELVRQSLSDLFSKLAQHRVSESQ